MKEQLEHYIQEHMEEYKYLANDLYEHPEIGNQKFHSMHVLCKMLRKEGFEVTEEYVVPAGFFDVWNSGEPGLIVAYICGYDALPEVGHGCGHNLIVGMSLTADCTLRNILLNIGGEARIIGTPIEENFGGKVSMAAAYVLDDVDTALTLHPDTENSPEGRTLTIYPLCFEFFGQNAHACTLQNGKSALDTAVMSYMSTSLLCQFAEPNTLIHGVIVYGREVTNVIPAYTSLKCYFHGKTTEYMKELCEKAKACTEGACTMSGCTSRIITYECPYDNYVTNYTLTDMLRDEHKSLGYPWEGANKVAQGSDDVGSVSYCYPVLQGYIKIADSCVNGHSHEMAATTISRQGSRVLFDEALALANIGRRLIVEPDTVEKTWKGLKANREQSHLLFFCCQRCRGNRVQIA